MAQIIFAGSASGTTAQLDANFSELYGFAKNLLSDGSGNVGIGTASPVARLTVSASSGTVRSVTQQTDSSGGSLAEMRATHGSGSAVRLAVGAGFGVVGTASSDALVVVTGDVERGRVEASGNWIKSVPAAPPTLSANGTLVMNLTSNTNLRISARGSDGVTRVANITLA